MVFALGAASVLGYFNTKLAKLQRLQLGSVLSHSDAGPGSARSRAPAPTRS